jgi:hypothetical protein
VRCHGAQCEVGAFENGREGYVLNDGFSCLASEAAELCFA